LAQATAPSARARKETDGAIKEMANITHEEMRVQASDTYAGQIVTSVKRNFGRCIEVLRLAPATSSSRSEMMLTLTVPVVAVATAILPAVLPQPGLRLMCALTLALVLALFVGHRLVIVQSMNKEQTYKLTGALMGTFLFGLVFALICADCMAMLTH